jgi:hypothetical protein
LVWLASTEFGIAIAFDPKTTKAIITMNTSPPGNVMGQFEQNVLPLTSTPVPSPSPVPVPSPSPVPVPSPSPSPVPIPIPVPVPIPPSTINAIKVQQIVGLLYNIIYFIQTRQPRNFIIYQLQTAMSYISASNVINASNMLQVLQMAIHAIQTKRPSASIIMTIQNVIIMLQRYSI